jgi:hypothetical protein
MHNGKIASNLGLYVYASAAIFLGIVGVASGDFAGPWQSVSAVTRFRTPFAYLTAAIELAAGLALFWRPTARFGAVALTVLYSVFTILWVPVYAKSLSEFDAIGNVFEQFSLVVAGVVLFTSLSPADSHFSHYESRVARLYSLSALSFGVGHIYYMPGLMTWIPKWLPPSQLFWSYVTTIGFFLAAVAIISDIMAPLASRLITAEIVGFEILVWIPKLLAGPRSHFNWAGNAICLALAGAPWVVADSICRSAGRGTRPRADQ